MEKNENSCISIIIHQSHVQMDQKSQLKTNHTVPHKRECGKPMYLTGSPGLKIRVQKQHKHIEISHCLPESPRGQERNEVIN